MSGKIYLALLASASCLCLAGQAAAQVYEPSSFYVRQTAPQPRMVAAERGNANMGGGFIQFLFGDPPPGGRYQQQPEYYDRRRTLLPPMDPQQSMRREEVEQAYDPAQGRIDPRFEKQVVEYSGRESPGTIVIDTPNKYLFLVQGDGKALRYGVGVGRPGFTWSGTKAITAKKEWPAWTPSPERLARRTDLPRHMEGGPDNPLGARAMYLGSTLYRIHGSNEPWTIGTNVSSGCIRMRNEDVIDLYGRVNVGTRVIVI